MPPAHDFTSSSRRPSDRQLTELLASALVEAGWVVNLDDSQQRGADIAATRGDAQLLIDLKRVSAPRADVVLGRVAQALLQATVAAHGTASQPVAIVHVAAPTKSLLARLDREVPRLLEGLVAKRPGWGVFSDEGLLRFHVPGVEPISREPGTPRASQTVPAFDPFTDRGQWALKVLLAPLLPAGLMNGAHRDSSRSNEVRELRNAYHLAARAGISVPTADRVVRWLRNERFLDQRSRELRPIRTRDLLDLWRSRSSGPRRIIEACWVVKTRSTMSRLEASLRSFAGSREDAARSVPDGPEHGLHESKDRACLASFSAADRLGWGIVRGMAPRLYTERPEAHLEELGLRYVAVGEPPDVVLFEPHFPESVFRAAVAQDAMAASDILQCWLDMRWERARGEEQAEELERGPLSLLLQPALP